MDNSPNGPSSAASISDEFCLVCRVQLKSVKVVHFCRVNWLFVASLQMFICGISEDDIYKVLWPVLSCPSRLSDAIYLFRSLFVRSIVPTRKNGRLCVCIGGAKKFLFFAFLYR